MCDWSIGKPVHGEYESDHSIGILVSRMYVKEYLIVLY